MNNQLTFVGKCLRAITYVACVYALRIASIFTGSMESLIQEVEDAEEMRRRGSVLKQRKF